MGTDRSMERILPLYNNDADRVHVFVVLRSLSTLVSKVLYRMSNIKRLGSYLELA